MSDTSKLHWLMSDTLKYVAYIWPKCRFQYWVKSFETCVWRLLQSRKKLSKQKHNG